MSTVSIRALRKSYGTFEALRGIDLEIAKGEVVCVIGPSGSGKSTLIRCINRLEAFDSSSEIRVDDIPVVPGRSLARVRAEVGMVFQNFNLFPHLTVRENVMLAPRRVRGTSRADAASSGRPPAGPRRALPSRRTSIPSICRAASSSASRLRGRWRWSRRCCCSTNRHPRSTPKWWARCWT